MLMTAYSRWANGTADRSGSSSGSNAAQNRFRARSGVGKITERHGQRLRRGAALNRDRQLVARLMSAHDAEHVVVARHAVTVDDGDHVAPPNVCARGALARRDLGDVGTRVHGKVRLLH